jgi:hypothetical protein
VLHPSRLIGAWRSNGSCAKWTEIIGSRNHGSKTGEEIIKQHAAQFDREKNDIGAENPNQGAKCN